MRVGDERGLVVGFTRSMMATIFSVERAASCLSEKVAKYAAMSAPATPLAEVGASMSTRLVGEWG